MCVLAVVTGAFRSRFGCPHAEQKENKSLEKDGRGIVEEKEEKNKNVLGRETHLSKQSASDNLYCSGDSPASPAEKELLMSCVIRQAFFWHP